MAGGGWIKIYRSIQDHWIWDNPIYLKWWLDLLLIVNHKPNDVLVNGKIETIDVGERLTSEIKLSERWNVDRKTVRRFLNLLEKEQMITLAKSRQKGTTVKVVKYSDYQQFSEVVRDNKKDNEVYNAKDITRDNGRDINKNDKNENNDKNEKNIYSDSADDKESMIPYKEIIDYLNNQTGKNFRNILSNQKFIKARWKDGYRLEDFKKVVDIKLLKWKNTEYEKYLQPSTLFGNKFDQYLNEIQYDLKNQANKTDSNENDFPDLGF